MNIEFVVGVWAMALRVLSFLWVVVWVLAPQPALAQQSPPPQEPILRIDPGMHTAAIRRIAVDAACTLLATGSDDKTVRLWRLPEGRLLRTLRVPIGPERDGAVYAVAMAPDGSWIAAGGRDAASASAGSRYVYVFLSTTGAMIARLGPVNASILHLVASGDGRYVAATLADGEGLRVWERAGADPASWRLIAEDKDYSGQRSEGAAFDHFGTLFTVADDGKLRRYASGYQAKPTWVAARGGRNVISVAVHPSGDRIAVGYDDSTAVEVYDAATLAWLFAADTKGVDNGNLANVAWSTDGTHLYAGGLFQRGWRSQVRAWDRAGEGSARELVGAQNTINHLLPCASTIAVGAGEPAFGLLIADGSRRPWHEGVQADLRDLRGEEVFSVATNGRRVRFGLELWGKNPVLFDLAAEQLLASPERPDDLTKADITSLPVTHWADTESPELGGVPINLEPLEVSRSFAIAPDKQRFVLGTEWSLRSYDHQGTQIWRKQASGGVWSVNIPRTGALVVAGYGDGTVRWHRLSDGQELLALFVHAKDRRWVAWTPKGYYMASPGAESLIGWHLNRGWDEAAQFFPVDRFRDQFNRRDIVKLVLETLDESQAIEEANRRANVKRAVEDVRDIAPPMVVIQGPENDSTFDRPEVTIEYNIFSPAGRTDQTVDFLVNNAALGARFVPQRDTATTTSHRVTLPLPPENVTITLVAREGSKVSEPTSLRLRWDGAKPGQVVLPRLRALLVGVNAYVSPKLTKLHFAAKDAADLGAFFAAHEGRSYRKVDAKILIDAKRADVLKGLSWLEKGSDKDDVNLLFLAGHGVTRDRTFYFMTADSDPDEPRDRAINRDDILQTVQGRKGAMVVMLDTCHSAGSAAGITSAVSQVDINRAANELGDRSLGVLLYASARGQQVSYERPEWGNGAFTRAMLDGLKGAADRDKLGYIDTEDLSSYVRRRVIEMTKGQQEPVRVKPDAAPEMKIVLLK